VALGVVSAYASSRAVSSLLFGVTPHDPATFFTVSMLLILVALVGAYVPARRALRVDPVVALRSE
jgi:ABC-type antimicrobial peptide transport system permease subunit